MNGYPHKTNVGKYCKDCKDKKEGCHIDCFAYNVLLAKHKMEKAEINKSVAKKKDYSDYVSSRVMKATRNLRERRK